VGAVPVPDRGRAHRVQHLPQHVQETQQGTLTRAKHMFIHPIQVSYRPFLGQNLVLCRPTARFHSVWRGLVPDHRVEHDPQHVQGTQQGLPRTSTPQPYTSDLHLSPTPNSSIWSYPDGWWEGDALGEEGGGGGREP